MSRIWKTCPDCGFKTWRANSWHVCPSVKNRVFPKLSISKIKQELKKKYPNQYRTLIKGLMNGSES